MQCTVTTVDVSTVDSVMGVGEVSSENPRGGRSLRSRLSVEERMVNERGTVIHEIQKRMRAG